MRCSACYPGLMDKKILLGIPTYKSVSADAFSYQMAFLLDAVNSGFVKHLVMEANMYVTMARNMMCRTAVELWKKGEISHLLMIDDDMLIPRGGVQKLIGRDLPVTGGAYYRRDLVPISYSLDPFQFHAAIPGEGLFMTDGTGCGCLLVECKVLEEMAQKFGDEWWFQNTIVKDFKNPAQEIYLGEDVFFFRRLREMGVKTFLDCDVQCGHLSVSVADRTMFEIKNGLRAFAPFLNPELQKSLDGAPQG